MILSRSPSLYTHVLIESYVESSKLLEFTTYVYIKFILTTGYGINYVCTPFRCGVLLMAISQVFFWLRNLKTKTKCSDGLRQGV